MKKNTPSERLINGIIKENPTFVLMLGMCPTLAITTSAINGIGMGLTTTVILAASNLMISLLRNFIPDSVRMPAYIVVVASFVTIVQMLLQGFIPFLYSSLGIYIPLIVVNCIILGRVRKEAVRTTGVRSSGRPIRTSCSPGNGRPQKDGQAGGRGRLPSCRPSAACRVCLPGHR